MSDLFGSAKPQAPLAERLRPQVLDEVVGQSHLLGSGKPLRMAFQSGKLPSMILWGPPGVGKTTLARLIAHSVEAEFIPISAVLSGIKDIRDAIERAEMVLQQSGRKTILFVDEVHRFNKGQQDAFLPYVESGLVTFIGATTENPSFEVNSALLSRAQVFVLQPLSQDELALLFQRALDEMQVEGLPTVLPFHRKIVNDAAFIGDAKANKFGIYTRWIETEWTNDIEAWSGIAEDGHAPAERNNVVVEVGGKRIEVSLPKRLLTGGGAAATTAGAAPKRKSSGGSHSGGGASGNAVKSPMQSTVVKIAVNVGDTVNEGDLVIVLEAMKMEQPMNAHKSGTVKSISAEVGVTVPAGTVLLEIE